MFSFIFRVRSSRKRQISCLLFAALSLCASAWGGTRDGGNIVGTGYPDPNVVRATKSYLPEADVSAMHTVIAAVEGQNKAVGAVLRTILHKVAEHSTKVTRDLPQGCYMVANFGVKNYYVTHSADDELTIKFSPEYSRLPWRGAVGAPSRERALMQILLLKTLVSGKSGTEQELAQVLLDIGAGKKIGPDQQALLDRFAASVEVSNEEATRSAASVKISNEAATDESLKTEDVALWRYLIPDSGHTSLCRGGVQFRRWKPSKELVQALAQLAKPASSSPIAFRELNHFVEGVVQGTIPIFAATGAGKQSHIAKLVRNHAGAEIVVFPRFFQLPVTDDRAEAPNQVKVVVHEGLHFVRNDPASADDEVADDAEDGFLSADEWVSQSAELIYDLMRGKPHDLLSFDSKPEPWSSSYDLDEWLRLKCAQIAKGGAGDKERVFAGLGLTEDEIRVNWDHREFGVRQISSTCAELANSGGYRE